jgi:hypothetical protein
MDKLQQLEPHVQSLKGEEQGKEKELMRRLVDRFRPAQARAVMATDHVQCYLLREILSSLNRLAMSADH